MAERFWRALVLIVVAFVAMPLIACGGSSKAKGPRLEKPSVAGTSITTGPPADANDATRQTIIGAYKNFWRVFFEDAGPSAANPEDGRIPQVATGQAMLNITSLLLRLQAHGEVSRGFPGVDALHPRLTQLNGVTATVEDCSSDPSGRYNAQSGQLMEPLDPAPKLETATLRLEGGAWKVADIKRSGPCAP